MSFLKPDPPQPPDPIRTAAGATATNVGTAVANQQMNNINQVTPQGALTYSQTGTFDWNDPTTGQTTTSRCRLRRSHFRRTNRIYLIWECRRRPIWVVWRHNKAGRYRTFWRRR